MYRKKNLDMTLYRGLSTDTKPDADFGSVFHEMDTGDIYRTDGHEWHQCGSLTGTDPSIYMSMWVRGNTKKAWELSALAGGHGDQGVWRTVTGNPISVNDALNASIGSLIVSHTTTQDGTPTPSAPVDIMCNNGVLQMVDDELPAGYQRQIGLEFDASTYYCISNFHLRGSDTVRVSFSMNKACNAFGCYTTTGASDNYSLYASTTASGKYLRYDGDTYNSYIPSAQLGNRLDVVITPTGTTGMPVDSVITPAEFESVADLCIGTTSPSASSSKLDGNFWGNFVVDGRLTLIPCKRLSDNVLGYYDPDSESFYEPIGSAPASLGVDTSHMTALSVVGTPEVLTVSDGTSAQTASVENLFGVGNYKDEQDIISGVVTRRCGIKVFDGTEAWRKGTSFYADISLGALESRHSCVCSHFVGKSTDSYTGDSNTIQVGYSADLIYWNRVYITANRATYATAADFTAWLASEYANGTPVIVVYPLAEETTEHATAQPLNTYSESTVVQAGSGTDITMTYKATE